MAYWMLECQRDPWRGGRSIEDWPDFPGIDNWLSGAPFSTPPPNPIVLHWDPQDESGPPQPLYKAGIPMMTHAVHHALLDVGVDNLDVYPVEVRSRTAPEVNRDYVAFNVVGIVRAADLSRSKHHADEELSLVAVGFDSLVIDESAARGLLLFRLAENVSGIVVHERVKQLLEARGLALTFVRPEDWFG